jgi:hypothetical protein
VELGHAAVDEVEHLLGRDRRGDELAGVDILVEPLEPMLQPRRDARTRPRREIRRLLKFCTGRMPGTIGISMPRARTAST